MKDKEVGVSDIDGKVFFVSLIQHQAMKTYGRVEVYLHAFLTLALVGGELSPSPFSCSTLLLDRRLGEAPKPVWLLWGTEKSLTLAKN
jgi:hypothetical protein